MRVNPITNAENQSMPLRPCFSKAGRALRCSTISLIRLAPNAVNEPKPAPGGEAKGALRVT